MDPRRPIEAIVRAISSTEVVSEARYYRRERVTCRETRTSSPLRTKNMQKQRPPVIDRSLTGYRGRRYRDGFDA